GYNPDPNATQTPTAIMGVRLLFSVIPAIFAFMGGIALILWYDLEGQKLMEMKTKLKECGL
ncbi:MFS transporter, partial [Candidatus Woesebacteria bacterium]